MAEVDAVKLALGILKPVLQNYMEQLKEQSRLIRVAPQHVEQLENDLVFLNEFLEESIVKMPDNLIMRDLLRDVRNHIYDAEDAIDSFLIDAVRSKSKYWSKSKLAEIAKRVEFIGNKVKTVRSKVENEINSSSHTTEDGEFKEYEGPPRKPKYMVGFAEEEQQLQERLSQETQQLDVIFITGTHGVGKTTLVAKIFDDPDIRMKFTIPPIWVRVSNPTTENLLLSILRKLDDLPQDASGNSNQELSQRVADCLKGKICLIVMDDVPEIDDPVTLMSAFESSDKNSKVLITTNNNEMARFINRRHPSIEVRPLQHNESWHLLQRQVFGQVECPQLLEVNGRLIVEQCEGLPLAIVTVADILAKKDSPLYEMSARKDLYGGITI
ncbi:hypothetical protein C2S51_003456 [Perilla frutescens var. frutescens]|nr:hypothetical protein C2S51_003456 [Perilla frutescens var. frutescens]